MAIEVTIRLTVEEAEKLLALLLEAEQTESVEVLIAKVENAMIVHTLTNEVSAMYTEMGL